MKQAIIESRDFQQLIDILIDEGFQIMAPTIRDGAIIYDRIEAVEDLPRGWTVGRSPAVERAAQKIAESIPGEIRNADSQKLYE